MIPRRLLSALTTALVESPAVALLGPRQAGKTTLALEVAGTPIGMADYLIAGVCLVRSARLLTRNVAHFQQVEGLRLA